MSISIGTTKTTDHGNNTFQHTVDANTTLLVVAVSYYENESRTPTGVTWDGTPLTEGITAQHGEPVNGDICNGVSMWYLSNPTSKTANIVVTWDGDLIEGPANVAVNLLGTSIVGPIRDADGSPINPCAADDTQTNTLSGVISTDLVISAAYDYDSDGTQTVGDWTWEAGYTVQATTLSPGAADCGIQIASKFNESSPSCTSDGPVLVSMAVKEAVPTATDFFEDTVDDTWLDTVDDVWFGSSSSSSSSSSSESSSSSSSSESSSSSSSSSAT